MKIRLNKILFSTSFLFFIFFVLVSCSVMGQAKQKKELTSDDYALWSILENPTISKKGLWASYSLRYQSKNDTLFVKRTDGKKTFSYPFGRKGKFCGDQWFACFGENDTLHLTNLEKGKDEFISEISAYEFSSNEKYLVFASTEKDHKKTLTIRNLLSGTVERIEEVTSWRLNNDLGKLAYCVETTTGTIGIVASLEDKVLPNVQLEFAEEIGTNIIWQKNSSSLVFVLQPVNIKNKVNMNSNKLAQYRFANKQLFVLNPSGVKNFPQNKHIESKGFDDLYISEDSQRIIFQLVPDTIINNNVSPLVEIWNGDDKLLYSERKRYGNLDDWAKLAVWYPENDEVFEFMTKETDAILSGNQGFALTSNLEPCERQYKYTPNRDYYLTNLKTKERKLWLHCHSGSLNMVTFMSPLDQYIAYFKEGNWFTYNIRNGEHINLTALIGVAFYDEANDIGDKPSSYGFYGWTSNDKAILVYDQYDIWEIFTDGSRAKRLTKGRENNVSFRSVKPNVNRQYQNFLGESEMIDLNSPILMNATSSDRSIQGYYTLEKGKVKPLHFSLNRISDVRKATAAEIYVYIQEDYSHPPSLQIKKGNKGKPNCIFQSNPQHDNYQWGRVSTITYVNSHGSRIKGLLYYPSDYKKGTLYPMIVHIYQKQTQNINRYINPSIYLYDGFNVTNMVTNGYFVLLPDINYTLGLPGDSAIDCVTAAVESVLSLGNIAPSKIGLIGHSFGGYETSYIITKSRLFATAIAGAAQTDYISGYLQVSENYKKAEFWRYEEYTNRMGKSLFENLDGYIYNSPVYNAQGIETPLLLWTGEKDKHVAPTQSMELYLAMRRLGKKVTMLQYSNEDHSLFNVEKQADLTFRVSEWFDYYLKDKPLKNWMSGK